MKKRIVFFGSGYYVIPVVKKLLEHGLELVITTEPDGRFIDYLKKENINYIYSKLKSKEDIDKVLKIKPDLGILASYGAIIPKNIIDIFPLGIFNIHPSLLPKYKGPSPIQHTILSGDKVAGVSVIKLDDKVDHGPILTQKIVELSGNETLLSLTEKLFLLGSDLIQEIVQKMENGLKPEEKDQEENSDVFTKKITKLDGKIDISNPPSVEEIKRKIRAFFPWPGLYLTASINKKPKNIKLLPQNKIQVEGAESHQDETSPLASEAKTSVGSLEKKFSNRIMIQVEGKNPMSLKDFVNGYSEGKEILEKLGLS